MISSLFHLEENSLIANLTGKNFMELVAIVNDIANIAEVENHHPDLYLHDYKKLKITITTHDEGNQVTEKDWSLAKKIEDYLHTLQLTH